MPKLNATVRLGATDPADGVARRRAAVHVNDVLVAEASFPPEATEGIVGPFEAAEGQQVFILCTDIDAAGNASPPTVFPVRVDDVTPPRSPAVEGVTLQVAEAA